MGIDEKKQYKNFPMKEITSFQIGGPVDLLLIPETIEDLREMIAYVKAEGMDFMIMGRGSNMIVSDKGIRGAIIQLADNFSDIALEENYLTAQAGASLRAVAEYAQGECLTGLEFAHGIPGSVGGAITMNAGAYVGEMVDVVDYVTAMDRAGNVRDYTNEEMHFAYRSSRVQQEGLIVLSATYALTPGDGAEIQKQMDDYWNRRVSKQPLEWPSAGSIFKRPPGYYAGQLIDEAGLRGLRHGGAQVSEKHCGFIINRGEATCQDVVELIKIVQESVYLEHGVRLDTEVKVIGEL